MINNMYILSKGQISSVSWITEIRNIDSRLLVNPIKYNYVYEKDSPKYILYKTIGYSHPGPGDGGGDFSLRVTDNNITVIYKTLLAKFNFYGIRVTPNDWFNSYRSERYQFTEFNQIRSLILKVIYDVPHGSILGPIIFLVYINDILH